MKVLFLQNMKRICKFGFGRHWEGIAQYLITITFWRWPLHNFTNKKLSIYFHSTCCRQWYTAEPKYYIIYLLEYRSNLVNYLLMRGNWTSSILSLNVWYWSIYQRMNNYGRSKNLFGLFSMINKVILVSKVSISGVFNAKLIHKSLSAWGCD